MFHLSKHVKIFAVIISLTLVLVVTGVVLAATIIVDSFNDGLQELTANSGTPTVNGVATGTMLGGERDAVVNYTSGTDIIALRIDYSNSDRAAFSAGDATRGTASLVWDGVDNDATVLSFLLNANLVDSGPDNDAFRLRVPSNDAPVNIRIRAYTTDASRYSQYTFQTPGGIVSTSPVDFVLPFASFTPTGGGADFSDVDAIEVFLDSTVAEAADIAIDQVDTVSSMREYGDLPNAYGSSVVDAYHERPTALRLGSNVDAESVSHPSTNADGDNNSDVNDEDGVTRIANSGDNPNWTPGISDDGNGGGVEVVVNGPCGSSPSTYCYLRAWIDWNDNGVLEPSEVIITGTTATSGGRITTPGTYPRYFDVPDPSPACYDGTCYARFRLCGGSNGANNCSSPTGNSTTGEVEDYAWPFGPTAVELSSLQVQPTTSPVAPIALVGISAAALIGVVFLVRRKKTA